MPREVSLRQQLRECFDTNAAGAAIVGETFAPLVQKSSDPRIVNVSSGAGSVGYRLSETDHFTYKAKVLPYRVSKAALSMVAADQMVFYPNVKIFLYCPGFTESNLGSHNKVEFGAKPVAEGVTPLIEILEGSKDDQPERFLTLSNLGAGGHYSW